jgi:tetratricopeptide (TPR) repeat protein
MNRYAPSAMLFWTHGQACLENSQFSAATKAFRQCMEQAGRPTHVPARPHITGGRSQLGLARAAAGDGDSDGAATLIHEGAERFSDCAEIQLARVRLQVSTGELDLAMRGVTRWLSDHQSDGEAWAVGAEVLLECGLVADAAVWGERALATITEDRNAIAFAVGGEVLLAQGDYDSALNAWLRAPTDQRCLAGIAILCLMTQEALPEEIDGHSQHMALRVAEIARRLSRAPDQGPWELLQRALEDADAGTFPFIEYLNLPVSV